MEKEYVLEYWMVDGEKFLGDPEFTKPAIEAMQRGQQMVIASPNVLVNTRNVVYVTKVEVVS